MRLTIRQRSRLPNLESNREILSSYRVASQIGEMLLSEVLSDIEIVPSQSDVLWYNNGSNGADDRRIRPTRTIFMFYVLDHVRYVGYFCKSIS